MCVCVCVCKTMETIVCNDQGSPKSSSSSTKLVVVSKV